MFGFFNKEKQEEKRLQRLKEHKNKKEDTLIRIQQQHFSDLKISESYVSEDLLDVMFVDNEKEILAIHTAPRKIEINMRSHDKHEEKRRFDLTLLHEITIYVQYKDNIVEYKINNYIDNLMISEEKRKLNQILEKLKRDEFYNITLWVDGAGGFAVEVCMYDLRWCKTVSKDTARENFIYWINILKKYLEEQWY